ncbi:unnamed protein product [Dibothriocephalus latus]|uniref:Uncharacterized protein n=1 Tax=Dibothriocephalus latus TaxID=60516 RepID=A0A3P7LR64_DIBLA|nr:unnamed protein product [Dibothriocephalus latus]
METANPTTTLSTADAVTPQPSVKPRKPVGLALHEAKPPKAPKASRVLDKPPQTPRVPPPGQDVLHKGLDSQKNSRVSQLVQVFEKIAENDGEIMDTSLASSSEDSMQRLLESNLQEGSVDPPLPVDSSKCGMGDTSASSGSSVKLNEASSVSMTDRETSCQQTRRRRPRRRTRSTHTFEVPVGSAEPQKVSTDLVTRGIKWSKNIIGQKNLKDDVDDHSRVVQTSAETRHVAWLVLYDSFDRDGFVCNLNSMVGVAIYSSSTLV